MDNIDKKLLIYKLFMGISDLIVLNFFDLESNKMLDEKIEVLQELNEGKAPMNIDNYYKVLELYPAKNIIWDL